MTRSVPALALILLATPLVAQQRNPLPAPQRLTWSVATANPNAARLGITLGAASAEGIRIEEITAGGPAEKAGLAVGDRLLAINDVSLRMDPADLDDPALGDMMSRRLQRTMADKKPGDAVTLRVQSGGAPRTVTLTAVAERELRAARAPVVGQAFSLTSARNRARLGVSLGGSPSKRDSIGVFVSGVTADGPAEKAGVVEGDRIARVNGVDVRVPREDAGDATMAQARVERLQREIAKLAPGDVVTLTVVTGGRSREVRVTTDSASTSAAPLMFFREGQMQELPFRELPAIRGVLPTAIRSTTVQGEALDRAVRVRVEGSLQRTREATERARNAVEGVRLEVPARVRVVEGTRTRVTI